METNLVPAMWIAWGAVVVVTLALYGYRSSVARDEEGQIFLDEAFNHEKAAQSQIAHKIARIQPAVHASLSVACLMTLVVIGYYAWWTFRSLWG